MVGNTYSIRFLLKGAWSQPHGIDFVGSMTDDARRHLPNTAYESITRLVDWQPWDRKGMGLHFHVFVDGVPHACRVTRECLGDHKLVDWLGGRERFARTLTSEKLRSIALRKLEGKFDPVVTTSDWKG